MRRFLVAGNWKMNGSSGANSTLLGGIREGLSGGDAVDLLVCPPFPYLGSVVAALEGSKVRVGAQNVSQFESGAYTGETSASMLRDVGCDYVIVGHSERRTLFAEASDVVAAKYLAALAQGLKPILCVGETLEEREGGRTEAVIDAQLDAVLDAAGVSTFAEAVVAYEPVWAIGTGRTATPEIAQEVHGFIRGWLGRRFGEAAAARIRIQYGGSVKPENAAALMAQPDVDGGLVGGASLDPESFAKIVCFREQG